MMKVIGTTLLILGALAAPATLAIEIDSVNPTNPSDFDGKSLPALACTSTNSGVTSIGRNGAVANNSSSIAVEILCPVEEDRFTSVALLLPAIRVIRATGAAAMNCFVVFRTGIGSVVTLNKSIATTGSIQEANFGVVAVPAGTIATTIGCRVPPKVSGRASSVVAYYHVDF